MICFCIFPLADFNIPIFILVLYYTPLQIVFAIGHLFAKDFGPCLLLFICKGLLSVLVLSYSFGFCYMSTKDAVIIYLSIYKGRCPYFRFCLQRTRSLLSAIHLQRITALVLWYSFSKDHCPFLCYSFAKDLCPCICYSFAKDRCLCLVLFIGKGPPLSEATHLQRTAILFLRYSFAKDHRPCLMLFICKGPQHLFYAISLQRTLLFLLSIHCPGKIRWTTTLAKHGETASP